MKKKLLPARTPLPRLRSDQEAADYFQTHSVAGAWDRLPKAAPVKASKRLETSIRERHTAAKSPISIRLAPNRLLRPRKSRLPNKSATRRNCGCGSPREL